MEEIIDIIIKAPVFSGCSKESIREIFAATPHRIRNKNEGSVIAYMGDKCEDVMMLVKGTIYTTMTNQEGKEVVIETLTAPTLLAPAFVYAQKNILPVNIIAKEQTTLLYISSTAFTEVLHSDKLLMMNFISIVSDRCQRLSRRLNDFALQSLRERVVEYLKAHQKITSVGWLARVLGVARPSLSRVLSELKSEGMIERTLEGIELKKRK